MTETTQPLSLDRLRAQTRLYEEFEIDGLGTVRLKKLSLPDKLQIVQLLADVPKDDAGRIANDADAIRFGIKLLGLAIVDEHDTPTFDSDEGAAALGMLAVGELNALIDAALEHNGLGSDEEPEKNGPSG